MDRPEPRTPESGWQARLALRFDRRGEQTRLAHAYHEAPLKVLRPSYPTGTGACHLTLLHNAGGMVAGDGVELAFELAPDTHVHLTTASAGKVYRSEGAIARQDVSMSLGTGAVAEWRPLETILFQSAQYEQTMRVDLASGAVWLGGELTRFGRTAMGERFLGGSWRSHTEIHRGETPLWIDRQWLPGEAAALDGAFGLAGWPVAGTLALVGRPVTPETVAALRAAWDGEGEAGVSRLAEGVVCRYRGPSCDAARAWFDAAARLLLA